MQMLLNVHRFLKLPATPGIIKGSSREDLQCGVDLKRHRLLQDTGTHCKVGRVCYWPSVGKEASMIRS